MRSDWDEIIAVNINRFKEGARVLEDIVRFILKDQILFEKIKALKQSVRVPIALNFPVNDLGGVNFHEENKRENVMALIQANARRMQEAARVLEELDATESYKTLRFQSYEIHKKLMQAFQEKMMRQQLQGLYVLCDVSLYSKDIMIKSINESVVTVCQLRMKTSEKKLIYEVAVEFKKRLRRDVLLILNDHLDIALACADGVHLGQTDLPLLAARRLVPSDFIIGISCHNLDEALLAASQGADYIGVGALFPTTTKKGAVATSLETLLEIKEKIDIPVCAIGGINLSRAELLYKNGIDFIVVQSAIWDAPESGRVIHDLCDMLSKIQNVKS